MLIFFFLTWTNFLLFQHTGMAIWRPYRIDRCDRTPFAGGNTLQHGQQFRGLLQNIQKGFEIDGFAWILSIVHAANQSPSSYVRIVGDGSGGPHQWGVPAAKRSFVFGVVRRGGWIHSTVHLELQAARHRKCHVQFGKGACIGGDACDGGRPRRYDRIGSGLSCCTRRNGHERSMLPAHRLVHSITGATLEAWILLQIQRIEWRFRWMGRTNHTRRPAKPWGVIDQHQTPLPYRCRCHRAPKSRVQFPIAVVSWCQRSSVCRHLFSSYRKWWRFNIHPVLRWFEWPKHQNQKQIPNIRWRKKGRFPNSDSKN